MVTVEYLKHLLHYNPRTGKWTWHNPNAPRLKRGDPAGANSHGYIRIKIDGKQHAAHRLAWLYMTGEWPPCRVDHKNNNPSANWWTNLRLATHGQNIGNSRRRKDNTVGLKGVTRGYKNQFVAQIQHDGKHIYIGLFKTARQAHSAYITKAKELYGEFARAA